MEAISGRMNKYCYNDINIIIDYAHTYSAVKEAISFVRNIAKKDLYVIVGCGGNREKEKRYMIGTLLNELDINIVLTTDNPRFEEPIDIINDIKKNITQEVVCFVDRKEAITKTLQKMKSGDYLLILGKGNESYMEISGIKYPYNDLDIINGYFKLS
jgi:UDP-N-acetylmuramoyl-L-alanyl-D-glutamate--2,6-diaminopimelate ligase